MHAVQVAKPRRNTGPDPWVRQQVMMRFSGRCARCGEYGASIQHRKPRRMGGTSNPAINFPSNLIWVCGSGTTGCHGHMESHRTEAYGNGWLLHAAEDPTEVPVLLWDGHRVLLDNVGGFCPAPNSEA